MRCISCLPSASDLLAVVSTILSFAHTLLLYSVMPPRLSTHVCCHILVCGLKVFRLLPAYPCCMLVHSSSSTQLSSISDILLSPALPLAPKASHSPIQKSKKRYTSLLAHGLATAFVCACAI